MKRIALIAILAAQSILFDQVPNGVITGRVLGIDGKPAAGVRVAALAAAEVQDRANDATTVSIAQTDASGLYRLENVIPGRYYITAGLVEILTYYPGVREAAGAKSVTVTGGAAMDGIDFAVVIPENLKITGHVIREDGSVPSVNPNNVGLETGNRLALIGRGATSNFGDIASDGSFAILNVRPGNYTLLAGPGLVGSGPRKPSVPVIDGKPAAGVRVAAVSPDANGQITSADTLVAITKTDVNGDYRIENIPQGRYGIVAGGSA
jgi:hypothetical protein